MSDNSKYSKVGSIVDQFIIDNSLTSHYYPKALARALWALREFNLDSFQDVKTCLLDVTDRNTAIAPKDLVDWVKAGAKVGQYVVTLSLNENLSKIQRTDADVNGVRALLSQNLPNGLDINSYGGYYFYNYNGASLAGLGGGLPSKGHFNIVQRDTYKEIILDYDFNCSQLYLEYITDGFDPCGETVVNPYLADYILKSIDFKYEEKDNPNRTEASIYRKGRDLFDAQRKAVGRFNQLDPGTMIAISRAHTRLTPKI